MSTTTHPLARPVTADGKSYTTVPLHPLTHADRRAAAKSSKLDIEQDDFLLHRLTGLPLPAIASLCFRDAQDLMQAFQGQAFDGDNRSDPGKTVPAGFAYPLRRPLQLPDGTTRDTLRLRELTRGDQKAASQYSADDFDVEEFLVARMVGLPLEDLAGLAIADSYELSRFFRRVVDAGEAVAQAGPSLDAGDAAVMDRDPAIAAV